jgi:hypothetical protein
VRLPLSLFVVPRPSFPSLVPPPYPSHFHLNTRSYRLKILALAQRTASQNLRTDRIPRMSVNPACLIEFPDSAVSLSSCPWIGFPCTASCPSCAHPFDVWCLPSEQRPPFSYFPLPSFVTPQPFYSARRSPAKVNRPRTCLLNSTGLFVNQSKDSVSYFY